MEYFSAHSSDYELKALKCEDELADTATSQRVVFDSVADKNVLSAYIFQIKQEDEGEDTRGGEEATHFKDKFRQDKKGKGVAEGRAEEKGRKGIKVTEAYKLRGHNNGKGKTAAGLKKRIHVSNSASRKCRMKSVTDNSSIQSTNESTNEFAMFWFCPRK